MIVKELKEYLKTVPDDFIIHVFNEKEKKMHDVISLWHAEGYLDFNFNDNN